MLSTFARGVVQGWAIWLTGKQITKRAAVPTTQPVYFPNRSGFLQAPSDRLAQEQYAEQNPWARSQVPILNHGLHGTPSLTHTPDWQHGGEREGSRNIIRNFGSAVNRNGSPYATPNPQRRAPAQHSSAGTIPVNSDPAEPLSSAAPPSDKATMQYFSSRDAPAAGSPLAVAKSRQNGGGGGGERELTGFRNISNMSGASTIDAPSSVEKDPDSGARRNMLPGIPTDSLTALPAFDTSQLYRQPFGGNAMKRNLPETYPNASFRPQDGAFGTPTPLPSGTGQQ